MSKLSFRARALDPSKPMPIYLAEELPDLPEYSAINRAVPQMPSGMEKEEESEHHLQRAICTGLIIPTPEVFEATDSEFYEKYYPTDYKMPKQMIHMQPLNLEQDVPDYDMDSADEQWVNTQGKRLDLDPLKFETMMDRLEKSSGQTVVTLNEAKALLKQDDELSIAVYDYWLNKRLKTQHPLILSVKTETRGNTTPNNPYLAFRRRTEKMQTRKNRKNDESSYEKMLKLRRDLSRAVTLLEMIKRREKIKREQLHLGIEIYEKRYQTQDFNGHLLSEFTANATKASRPAFAPIYSNQYSAHHSALSGSAGAGASGSGSYHGPSSSSSQYHHVAGTSSSKRDSESLSSSRKEKRQYKKRKHKIQKDRPSASSSTVTGSSAVGLGSTSVGTGGSGGYHHYKYHPAGTGVSGLGGIAAPGSVSSRGDATVGTGLGSGTADPALSSDEEELANLQGTTAPEEEYAYAFRRSKLSQYHRPITKGFGDWPWVSKEENGKADLRYRFALTSLRHPRPRCIGFARRRIGRGGRVIIDRVSTDLDDLWSRLDYKIIDSETTPAAAVAVEPEEESIVIPVPSSAGAAALTAATATTTNSTPATSTTVLSQMERKWNELESAIAVNSGLKRTRQLVIKEETDLDDLFMANFGLARRRRIDDLVKVEAMEDESVNGRLIGDEVEVKQEKCSDERTSVAAAAGVTSSSTFVISSNSGSSSSTSVSVNNSENNVIKSEAGGIVTVKQEVLEDYEHMIDNVNNSYRNRISNNSNSNSSSSSSSSSNVNSRNNFNQSFSNSINNSLQNRTVSQYQQQLLQQSLRALQQKTTAPGVRSSGSRDASGSSRLNEDLGLDESAPAVDSKAIASVYTDLLNDIQSSWLHFRPKTPEPMPLMEDGLLDDDPLFQTDANRIALELQALDAELPGDIFNSAESVYRTKQFALDSLVEPHPLGLEGAAVTKDATDELGIKLETCSNSDNNLSGDSLNDLNLSLSESNEDEKMLDKILQECQIDDMKSLNQTSNFWNGILEDGILNQLETADETGAGTGGDVKEDPLTINELVSPPPVEGLPVHKIGYCSELVGYDRLTNVERYKSKRRKVLKRCNYLVGSSFFAVRNPPTEEIFKKLSDTDANVPSEGEKAEGVEAAPIADAEVKVEEESDSVSATIPADQIKIEPPDELLAACSPSASSQSAPHLQTNTSVLPTGSSSFQQHSLSAPQIKLEPINHLQTVSHTTAVAATVSQPTAATSFLITSPSVQVVQPSQATTTMLNPLVASAQTTVPVVTAQHQQQQQQHPQHSTLTGQITLTGNAGSASSSGTSTPTGSYIVQHTTPIVLSQQQMQQIATSGGNIVTVSGNQVLTAATKQALQQHSQQQQQQHIQLQHATHSHQGETYVLTTATPTGQSPLKKQINGPNDNKTVKHNVINPKLHTLINQKLAASGQKTGDLSKKQFEMLSKALLSQKMIVKSATPANHGASAAAAAAAQVVQQQQLQQQQQGTSGTSTYNVIQNAAGQPITILSATSQNPQQATQNKIILTSSPQLIQQAAGQLMAAAAAASPHGKISINSSLMQQQQQGQQIAQFHTTDGGQGQTISGVTGGQQQQNVKFEKAVNMLFDADKNRIVYANIKNSRGGQFLAQLNPKVVNIIQPIQQQKLINSVGAMQQQQQTATNVQSILGTSSTGATTIVNSKGGIQRIPAVSIRAQQLHQQQQQQHQHQQQQQQGQQQLDSHGTTTVAVATNNATNSIKFIQVTPAVAAAVSAASATVTDNSAVVAASGSGTGSLIIPSSSGAAAGTAGSGTNNSAAAPTSINITNR